MTLAAAYHSMRAATPIHPTHQVVDAPHAALYRPVREAAWRGRRLRPFSTPADCFGKRAPSCTAPESRSRRGSYSRTTRFSASATAMSWSKPFRRALPRPASRPRRGTRVRGDAGCRGDPRRAGRSHIASVMRSDGAWPPPGHHDKTADAWGVNATRWLSVCCCDACRQAWTGHGLDPSVVRTALREAVRADSGLPSTIADCLLRVRHHTADLLRTEVIAAIRAVAPDIRRPARPARSVGHRSIARPDRQRGPRRRHCAGTGLAARARHRRDARAGRRHRPTRFGVPDRPRARVGGGTGTSSARGGSH